MLKSLLDVLIWIGAACIFLPIFMTLYATACITLRSKKLLIPRSFAYIAEQVYHLFPHT